MSAIQDIAGFFVFLFAAFLMFYLGYICGKDNNKPLRDDRGRFTKRYW